MSQGPFLRKYGVQTTINFHLFEIDGVAFRVDAADGGSDCSIMKNEGAEATCTNDFTDEGTGYSLVLTNIEMQAARIVVYVIDSATKVWLDTAIVVETYGNASAQHAFDLDTASTAQTADHTAGIADIPTVAEFEARTIVAANYTVVGDLGTVQSADHTAGIADIPTTAEFEARSLVSADYTIVADLGTVQSADNNTILAHADYGLAKLVRSTTPANTLDIEAGGCVGVDWGNVANKTTANDLSATDIQLCDTITTYTGNTKQTSDHTAGIADIPTVAEFNARSLVSADYTVVADLGTVQSADHTAGIADIPTVAEFNARSIVSADYTVVGDLGTVQSADNDTKLTDIQSRIPAALSGGSIKADVLAVSTSTDAADKLEASAETIVIGTVSHDNTAASTTVFYSDDITEATADHFNGRIVIFTSGALIQQATDITDYALDTGEGKFTVTALTESPADNVTFVIV